MNVQSPVTLSTETVGMLEHVITTRQTTRSFGPDLPPREAIEQVIRAGYYAPYAILGVDPHEPLRFFIVLERGSEKRDKVQSLFIQHVEQMARLTASPLVLRLMRFTDRLRLHRSLPTEAYQQAAMLARHAATQTGHFLHMREAPYMVIIAEKKRVPLAVSDLERQSLAHCLQNMWLMATALDLGFQPNSLIAALNADREFCAMFGISPYEYELDACLIGYPARPHERIPKPFDAQHTIRWG